MIEYGYQFLHGELKIDFVTQFDAEVSGMEKDRPAIYLETDGGQLITIVLVDIEGREWRLPTTTPAEDLLAFVSIDYSDYRKALTALWRNHPLFEEGIDISIPAYQDLVARALALPAMLKERDPVSWFTVSLRLNHYALRLPDLDDGSASFLLDSGAQLLRIAEDPIRTQIRLRNIFDVAFDGMERATQRERFEKLTRVYPKVLNRHYHFRWAEAAAGPIPFGERMEFAATTMEDLRMLELTLYFRQDDQRIARCEYCWDYFIPKTKKQTCYCDRRHGGKTCKQLGPNLKRHMGPEMDETLRIFDQLYHRMAARRDRYEAAAPGEQDGLIQLSDTEFYQWSQDASEARMKYLLGELTAEDFLRGIDLFGELNGYQPSAPRDPEQSVWQKTIEGNIDFDSSRLKPIQSLKIDLDSPDEAEWTTITPEEQIRRAQKGHQSLREKYGREEDGKES